MSTQQGFERVWLGLRSASTVWTANDTTEPCAASDVGKQVYSKSGSATPIATNGDGSARTVLGLLDRFDATDHAAVPCGITQVRFDYGRDKRAQQVNQGIGRAARVIMFGGDPSGDLGKRGPARQCGTFGNPKSLGTLFELFTLYIWAADTTYPRDSLKQEVATRTLHNSVNAALWPLTRASGPQGHYTFEREKWVNPENPERMFGRELECVGVIESVLPDAVAITVPAPETIIHPLVNGHEPERVFNSVFSAEFA